jgi:hypothetical protein
MKGIYLRLAFICFLLCVIISVQYAIANYSGALDFYIVDIFLPLQKWRNSLFNRVSISIGDILYLLLFLLFLLLLIRLVYFGFTFRKNKIYFGLELVRVVTFLLVLYSAFLILWGGNYYRPALSAKWDYKSTKWDTAGLIRLNEFLIEKMNETEDSALVYPDLKTLNVQTNRYYHQQFGRQLPSLKVKATALGYLLNYIGVHGYYNPFSGESQFNRFIPDFMHPFVISHEMAHQAGIAAEDDANLLAYIIGVRSEDPAFRYSAYFNLFLYAFSDLKDRNNLAAGRLLQRLNPQSRKDLLTLKEMYERYKSSLRGFSNSLYDEYLILHGQQKGLNSYNEVTHWVFYWEFMAKEKAAIQICPVL